MTLQVMTAGAEARPVSEAAGSRRRLDASPTETERNGAGTGILAGRNRKGRMPRSESNRRTVMAAAGGQPPRRGNMQLYGLI